MDDRAMCKRVGLGGRGLGNSSHAGKRQQHCRRQPAARMPRRSIQRLISRIAGKPYRSAMSTLLTAGIQLNSLH
ncbi:hypothetical protein QSH39_019080 [Xanthomonas arboricola pv. corylina]|uniref:hypothetical protein n=2 Tax=Xanthomonas arboricola TaxID=56448 RepID=UPI002157318D|nr:hypothetical protein [Xanthomonas arboricola]MDN0204816.1 hypothetical protein [Xanthomonas arboricola pv. corylina]